MADHDFGCSNNTYSIVQNPNSFDCRVDGSSLRVLLAIFYSLFFLLGLAGNVLALWVFFHLHSKKNSVRIFLINLAVADLLLVVCLPFRIAYHANYDCWVFKPVLCNVVGNVFYMNMYMSIFLLGLISIDRYLKLQRISRRQKFLGIRQSMIVCCLLWVLSIAAIVPLIFFSKNGTVDINKCFQYKSLKNNSWKAYFNLFIVILFWVVYSALVLSYGKIAMGLLRVSQEKPDFPNAGNYSKTAHKSFFILFLFTLCFVPYHLVRIFYIYSQITELSCQWNEVLDKTNEIALLLSAFNSCLDPVMYFLLCGSVRRVALRVICECFRLKSSGSSGSSTSESKKSKGDHLSESEINTLRQKV